MQTQRARWKRGKLDGKIVGRNRKVGSEWLRDFLSHFWYSHFATDIFAHREKSGKQEKRERRKKIIRLWQNIDQVKLFAAGFGGSLGGDLRGRERKISLCEKCCITSFPSAAWNGFFFVVTIRYKSEKFLFSARLKIFRNTRPATFHAFRARFGYITAMLQFRFERDFISGNEK